ncbi:MAG: sugar MFS transporter [Chitinophagales bacterium]
MASNKQSSIIPITIIGILFFIFGFVTWLNGTLIPYLKIACELNTFQSLLVAFAFYISYFVMALPSSWILQKTGFKNGMMLGLIVMAIGTLLFIPAANSREYGLFLLGLFVIGTGLSILQTASNPYITILGPIESAAKRISIMGICNKVAGAIAPIILGAIVLADADTFVADLAGLDAVEKAARLDELARRVIAPYMMMTAVLVALALFVRFSPLQEINPEEESAEGIAGDTRSSVFQYPNLVLGVLAIFCCVGVEVIAGDTIGGYGTTQGIALSEAKNFTSFTLSAMVVGYIIGILAIPKYISQSKALSISAVLGILFAMMAILSSGYNSVLFIALLGLANALVWPAIWPLAIQGLGKFTKTGSAMLIMGIAGGAIMPLVYGAFADMPAFGPKLAYIVLVPLYLFLLFFSEKGHKIARW